MEWFKSKDFADMSFQDVKTHSSLLIWYLDALYKKFSGLNEGTVKTLSKTSCIKIENLPPQGSICNTVFEKPDLRRRDRMRAV